MYQENYCNDRCDSSQITFFIKGENIQYYASLLFTMSALCSGVTKSDRNINHHLPHGKCNCKAFTCLKHLYSISPVYSFAEKVKIQICLLKKSSFRLRHNPQKELYFFLCLCPDRLGL